MRTVTTICIVLVAALVFDACRSVLSRKYEYEEDVYLGLDGSATIYINASVPALVALRGARLDVDPRARLDRALVRRLFESPVTHVTAVTASRRDNRRYVHVKVEAPDINRLAAASPFAWSSYSFARRDGLVEFHQRLGPSAAVDVGQVGWSGAELIAIRLHLPSRVPFHNSPSRKIERGNIIAWEQPLADRLRSAPLEIAVHMEGESILFRTLSLFGLMIGLAALTFGVVIWLVMRRGSGAASPSREQEAL